MAGPRSFAEIVASTARQKLAAARARQNPDTRAEKPRDAIIHGLQIVGDVIAGDGYVFSPSGLKFARKCDDFTFRILMQSDRNNLAGQRAAVWVHAAVYSRNLTVWSKAHGSDWIRPNAPFPLPVFAEQLGYLCEPAEWLEWDFSNASRRSLVAETLVASIRQGAYPLFSAFEAGGENVARLTDRDWYCAEGVLSFLLSTEQFALAGEALQRFLGKRPVLREEFDRLRREFAERGVPKYRSGGAHDLAAFAVATGYPWRI